MVRFPKIAFLAKAQSLYQDYLAACFRNASQPEHVKINGVWPNKLLTTYRISQREPNRKFKVPREILKMRLLIFWLNVAKVRKLILLRFRYDPVARNTDQSPFHMNEAGSQACGTLVLKGSIRVPLLHAALLGTSFF